MRFSDNRVNTFKAHFFEQLSKKGIAEGELRSLFSILCSTRLGIKPYQLQVDPDLRMSESQILKVIGDLKKLKSHIPIQYVLGESEFRGRRFKVDPSVLIPRQETEELIEWIARSETSSDLSILDIGTGSGCIAISLALELISARVSAIDISSAALTLAGENAQNLKASVSFLKEDIRDPKTAFRNLDLIVSNPPYVTRSEEASMTEGVLNNEPDLALFVADDNPLEFYRHIALFGKQSLKKGGRLFFEINEAYGNEVIDLLNSLNYSASELNKDLNGKDRMIRSIL